MDRLLGEHWASSALGTLPKVLGYLALLGIAAFFIRLYQVRMMFRRIQKEYGIPMMEHSFLFGHLWTIGKVVMKTKFPQDAHTHWNMHLLQNEFPELASAGLFYMDVWPMSYPMLAVFNPDMMAQFTQDQSLPKFWAQAGAEFKHFTHGRDLVHLEGQEWKTARAMFNPGFSSRNLLTLVPAFIEETQVFKDRLRKVADRGEVVKLEDFTTYLTVDIIGRAVLGTRLDSQIKENSLVTAMIKQLGLIYLALDLPKQLSPTRHIKHWLYNRQFRNAMMPLIQDTVRNYEKIEGPKTILSLALKSYVDEVQDYAVKGSIPDDFIESVVQHVKIFLFAGHDTTATTLAYCYYMLSLHPEILAKVRAEHDEVLGPDPAGAADRILADPTLTSKLPYTHAVIKEILRLYPPVGGSIRQGTKGFFLTNPQTGIRYPTEGLMVHPTATTLHRDAHYFPEPHRFLPDRWLLRDEADPYHPSKNTWRPFEMGPRGCIGQELAQLEIRLVLALTVREFDFQDMYPADAPELFGYKAYQVDLPDLVGTGHVKAQLPVKITTR